MLETRHLRVLRAVARSGSFSGAARELGCSQPAVSQQMKVLEQAVGTPLLLRTGRTMQLTEAGKALNRHAAGIIAGLTAAAEEVAAIAGLRAGRVRLVAFPSGSASVVPSAVADLRAAHPQVRVSLEEAQPQDAVARLRTGECDVALAFRYLDSPEEDDWTDLVVRPLLADRLVGVLPPRHRLASESGERLAQVSLGDLSGESWIAGCPRCRRHLVEACERVGFTPRIDFATDDYPARIGLVAAGLGVAVLPELALAAVRRTGVAVVEVRPEVRREVVALALPDLVNVPAVDVMLGRLSRAALRVTAAGRHRAV